MIFLTTMKMMVNEIMMVKEMVIVKEMMMVKEMVMVRWTILFAGSSGLEAECRRAPARFSQFTALQQQLTSVRMISFSFDTICLKRLNNYIPSCI